MQFSRFLALFSFLSSYYNKVLPLACAINIRLCKITQGIGKYTLIEPILLIPSLNAHIDLWHLLYFYPTTKDTQKKVFHVSCSKTNHPYGFEYLIFLSLIECIIHKPLYAHSIIALTTSQSSYLNINPS
jgi:hypothetical protein